MPLPLALLPLILLQAGPMVGDGPAPGMNLPQIDLPTGPNRRRQGPTAADDAPPPPRSRLAGCLAKAANDPDGAVDVATGWLRETAGEAQVGAQLCLGTALSGTGDWSGAEAAFLAGRASAPETDHLARAKLGAMAGNAALAENAAARALATLDAAAIEARAAQNPLLGAEIGIDRARALVVLHRENEAAAALADARAASPQNALGWLLSATLSRRMGHLAEAQAQIETAASLTPTDPEIGLEAGVIAMLAGHEGAARKSWESVLSAAPDSEAGQHARAYLAQLGPAPAIPAPHP
jgi:tetratricopeptide (TPR) repeat protein